MPKLKTRKTIAKRIKLSNPKKGSAKKKKVQKRRSGQAHGNLKESGKKTRKKRRAGQISVREQANIKKSLPYNN